MFDSQWSLIGTRPSDLWMAMPAEEPPTGIPPIPGGGPSPPGPSAGTTRSGWRRTMLRSAGEPIAPRRWRWPVRVVETRRPEGTSVQRPHHPIRWTGRQRRTLGVGGVVQLHAEIVANADPGHARLALEHTVPAVEAGRRVLCLARVAVVPFLAGHLGADPVGHHAAVMGQVADRKAVGLEAAGTGAQDHALGGNLDQVAIVQRETRGTGDAALVLDEMGDHDPLDQRDAARHQGPREGLVVER